MDEKYAIQLQSPKTQFFVPHLYDVKFAFQLHKGQYRKSGEPYITHPVAVADLLREIGASASVIAAGFLHDVVEDTYIGLEDLEKLFGKKVAELVDGVSKLDKINFESKEEADAANLRKMIMAMSNDIRVLLIKLAVLFLADSFD